VAEDEVLVEARPDLAVEVDVEELAVPQRLGDAVGEIQPGHLLVPDLGVDAHHLPMFEHLDERQRVPDCRQQDVPPRLVRFRLDREAQTVALVGHVLGKQVQPLPVAIQSSADVLAGVTLRAFATAHNTNVRAPRSAG
jgi:hypothetical protein